MFYLGVIISGRVMDVTEIDIRLQTTQIFLKNNKIKSWQKKKKAQTIEIIVQVSLCKGNPGHLGIDRLPGKE